MNSKLIGKIATITNKDSHIYGEYGMITHFDGEYYYIAPWCTTMETALKESNLIFKRNEFKIKGTRKVKL